MTSYQGRMALLMLSIMIAIVLGASCSRGGDDADGTADDVNMELTVTPDPPEVGPATLEIELTDEEGKPIEGAELAIEGNMSHAGMEPVIVEASGGQAGLYTSEGFEFTMGGDWIITVTGTLPDGRAIERTFDLSGVAS